MVQGSTTYGNIYNGQGDRLRQTVNGVPTTYVLDLNAGLTQVLSDGSNTYLYGTSRIAEKQTGGWRYYAGDALGSVRQLVDNTGAVTLAKSYQPFGTPLTSVGTGTTMYGFTGEQRDPTGLVYLRARFYSPELGIFLSRDPFPGFLTQPASLTPYQYAFKNPVRYTDPSGENPLFLLIGAIGGLLGGAIYGYGSQVVRNFNSGDFSECPWAAFTTNIDAGQIAFYAVAGTLLGLGIGGIMVGIQALAGYLGAVETANIACGGDMCASEVKDANQFWTRTVNFKGNLVYQRPDLIDPNLSQGGLSNLQRMQNGLAPFARDGSKIVLHHMLQTMEGPIAEVTDTFHRIYSKTIHINPNTIPSGIDRFAFNLWRAEYWMERAKDFSILK